jgi:rhodanese-related sulfurtransferase
MPRGQARADPVAIVGAWVDGPPVWGGAARIMRRVALRTCLEAMGLIALSVAVGIAGNAWGESGIALGKDHLRRQRPAPGDGPLARDQSLDAAAADPAVAGKPEVLSNIAVGAESDPHAGATTFSRNGFQFITLEGVRALFEGSEYRQESGLHVIIDARDEDHFREGHIPGAYQLDHYRSERFLPELLPICLTANRIVVYCNGGECEDSMLAAEDLMLEGVDPVALFVYEGGIVEWREAGLPIEIGPRNSGETASGPGGR